MPGGLVTVVSGEENEEVEGITLRRRFPNAERDSSHGSRESAVFVQHRVGGPANNVGLVFLNPRRDYRCLLPGTGVLVPPKTPPVHLYVSVGGGGGSGGGNSEAGAVHLSLFTFSLSNRSAVRPDENALTVLSMHRVEERWREGEGIHRMNYRGF